MNKTHNGLQSLKNGLNHFKLTGYEVHQFQDKNKYTLNDNTGTSLTGWWDYDKLNHFILGYGKAVNKYKSL